MLSRAKPEISMLLVCQNTFWLVLCGENEGESSKEDRGEKGREQCARGENEGRTAQMIGEEGREKCAGWGE
jgi:hypothetical protein